MLVNAACKTASDHVQANDDHAGSCRRRVRLPFRFVGFRSMMIRKVLASLANPPQTFPSRPRPIRMEAKLTAVGAFRAVNGADLALEASGVVEKIHSESGEDVAAGQPLLELRKDDDDASSNR